MRRFAMIKRYSALLTALFASLMLAHLPAQADGLEDVVKRGTLKVAVPQDFPPFGSVGPDMKPRGLDIDTAKLLADRSEEHTSELQSLMRISYAVFCLKKKKYTMHKQHAFNKDVRSHIIIRNLN